MRILKNNLVLPFLVLSYLSLSCSTNGKNDKKNGYIYSDTYKKYLNSDNESSENSNVNYKNADYSIKRLFLLLGEEGFLYNSKYDFYAIYMYMHPIRDSIDFYILKSKDSITSFAVKRFEDSKRLLYVDKENGDKFDKKEFSIAMTSKLIGPEMLPHIDNIFDKTISLTVSEIKYVPEYHAAIRGLYLFHNKEYYLITDYNLERNGMNEIDSFFRKSDLLGTR